VSPASSRSKQTDRVTEEAANVTMLYEAEVPQHSDVAQYAMFADSTKICR
jgi:hypothetical protein